MVTIMIVPIAAHIMTGHVMTGHVTSAATPWAHSATAEARRSRHPTEMPATATATRGTQRNGRGRQNRSGADYAKYKF